MKVPHHGSSDPGLPEVLTRLRPRVRVIPVGRNTHGHAVPSTLAAPRAVVPVVRRTDHDGTVSVHIADSTAFVVVRPLRSSGSGRPVLHRRLSRQGGGALR
jgi:beta-lactamase superfamily II metal-dependent hydrolase